MALGVPTAAGDVVVVDRAGLSALFGAVQAAGYQIVGPTLREGAIVYDRIQTPDELPAGWTDLQQPGAYRLHQRDDSALFGYAVGPHSWKKYLHVPVQRLWEAQRSADGSVEAVVSSPTADKLALIGVRSCELHAIAIQDRVLMDGPMADHHYAARRSNILIVAVNCAVAGGTCFCASMKTGPAVTHGFDLAMTELIDASSHRFVVEIGSARGAAIMADVPCYRAGESDVGAARRIVERTEAQMGRHLQTDGIKELLYSNLEHARWDDVASRCLACANCTIVCPTCFCTTVEDKISLDGTTSEHVRQWDSCFTMDFTHLHGGSVRGSVKSRYRQWMTHKLASWIDQFGSSGCVGCGRCITWCPVGIDLTEEAAVIRESDLRKSDRSQVEAGGQEHGD